MKLIDIIATEDYRIKGTVEDVNIDFLTLDSRKCRENSLYFAISGTQVDGHSFIEGAYKNGAVAAVVEHEVECDIPQIIIKDTRVAMAHMASTFYGNPKDSLTLIGVTGTNGKTSISYMVRDIANANGISCGVIGTGGIYLDKKKLDIKFLTSTTPDPIDLQYALSVLRDNGAKWVVMEVTAHALDLNKVDGMYFTSAGFTNLTEDHLDYFITIENYAKAKEKLFDKACSECGIINVDDAFGEKLTHVAKKSITYSLSKPADLEATDIEIFEFSSRFTLRYKDGKYPVTVATTGLFNVQNVLCAIGCALNAGLCINSCIRGIAAFTSVPGRFEAVDTKDTGKTVIVDYAHTPDGLENVLKAVNGFKKGKLICVFGCGGNRDALKRPIMGRLAGELADYVILTSDNPRFEEPEAIIDEIEAGIKETARPYTRNADRTEAIRTALEIAQKGDIIAICGKGDEDYQEIKGVKHHFSDREVVEALISKAN